MACESDARVSYAKLTPAGMATSFTESNEFDGVSSTSLNPKFAAVNVYVVSSAMTMVLFAPAGASFTGVTAMETVATLLSAVPSLALYVKLSGPK